MTSPDTANIFRRLPLILILVAALYAAWTVYSRWNAVRQARIAAESREIERARRDVEINGGSQLKITTLYSTPKSITKGQPAQICYGVINAKSVAFEPPINSVWPSMNRCVDIDPRATTTYTLTASDNNGRTETAQVSIEVK